MTLPNDHNERLEVARRVAEWELGDDSHADVIVAAYLNPEQAAERLADEKGEPLEEEANNGDD
jgi:hypothetical protein